MAINPNSAYPLKTTAPSANYPYGGAQNVTVDGDGTGSPWVANVLNDIWGILQKLLDHAGITPSGSPDTVVASQYFDALRATAGYPGLIVPLALNADPATLGLRILPLIGSNVLQSSYPDLVAATYVGDPANPTANSFIKTDAFGTPTLPGTHFLIPTMRGRFLRGLDPTAIRDEGGSGRIIGNYQTGAVSAHEHNVKDNGGALMGDQAIQINTTPTTFTVLGDLGGGAFPGSADDIISGNNSTSDNRPYNMAVDFGIWY